MLHQKEYNEYLEEKKASDEEKVKKRKDTGPIKLLCMLVKNAGCHIAY